MIPFGDMRQGGSEKAFPGKIISNKSNPSCTRPVQRPVRKLLPNFTFHKRGGTRMWIDESFAAPSFVNSLAHADRWFEDPSCQIIKDQEKTKVGRLIIRIGECDHLVFLKQFNAASRRHWIGSWFVSSRAFKTLEGASILRSAQVPIAVPFAAVEQRRWGGLTNSLFLTR